MTVTLPPKKSINSEHDIHSLRDLNLRLKNPPPPPPPPPAPTRRLWVDRDLKHKVWTKMRHMDFCTEARALNHCKDRLPRNLCPHCEHLFFAKDLMEETDRAYVYRCPNCGAMLTIYKAPVSA